MNRKRCSAFKERSPPKESSVTGASQRKPDASLIFQDSGEKRVAFSEAARKWVAMVVSQSPPPLRLRCPGYWVPAMPAMAALASLENRQHERTRHQNETPSEAAAIRHRE